MFSLFASTYFFSNQDISISLVLDEGILSTRVYSVGRAWGGNHKTDTPFKTIKKEVISKVAKQLLEADTRKYLPMIKQLMEDRDGYKKGNSKN